MSLHQFYTRPMSPNFCFRWLILLVRVISVYFEQVRKGSSAVVGSKCFCTP